jgi:thioredoxin reductase (NADPH)
MKPWDPPEEKLFPTINEQLDEWQAQRKPKFSGIKVYGYPYTPKAHLIKDFLAGNLFPYRWYDLEVDPEATQWIDQSGLNDAPLPIVVTEDGTVLQDPEIEEVANALGQNAERHHDIYDTVIIGAGPAGLGAAVYGGSEGLQTAVIEKRAPGGQAGTSSRIENYLGFPKGLSGSELSRRAMAQATRFGIDFLSPREVSSIEVKEEYKHLKLTNGEELLTRSVVMAMGVDYRMLEADNLADFNGAGVYYGAASTEAQSCKNQDVYIVGGGNSAGQAAVYLSNYARNVYICIRKPDLTSSMSAYLIDQIAGISNIIVTPFTQITGAKGDDRIREIQLQNKNDQSEHWVELGALFIFIGAKPFTEWIPQGILRDSRGFVLTGRDLKAHPEFEKIWKEDRDPSHLETSVPGIFAAGDVRSGAMNRVASAVGEGAMSISMVHKYLSIY